MHLLVGSPGPAPRQKGYRTVKIASPGLTPVISKKHPLAKAAKSKNAESILPKLRTVVTHDTSQVDIARSAGITQDGKQIFVQNSEQKFAAIMAGIGAGHLPKSRIAPYLKSGDLVALRFSEANPHEHFLAWKIANKGKGLRALTQCFEKRLKS